MAGAKGLASSFGFALLVGSSVVPPTSAGFGTCFSGPAEAVLGLLGLFVD
jgi:hypothetical protein